MIIWHNIGPIPAAKSRLLLLGQCHCLHRSIAGPTTAAFFDCLNLSTFSRNLAQHRPYTMPIVSFTIASSSESRRARVGLMDGTLLGNVSLLLRQTILEMKKPEFGTTLARFCAENKCWRPEFGPELAIGCQVHTGVIILATARYWQPIFGKFLAMLGQCWAVSNFALGQYFE